MKPYLLELSHQPKDWMTNEFLKDCLLVMWNRREGVLSQNGNAGLGCV